MMGGLTAIFESRIPAPPACRGNKRVTQITAFASRGASLGNAAQPKRIFVVFPVFVVKNALFQTKAA
jgi:hypothetical protein